MNCDKISLENDSPSMASVLKEMVCHVGEMYVRNQGWSKCRSEAF